MTTTEVPISEQTDREMGLTDRTYAIPMLHVEQMSAAAAHVSRYWGEYGYRLGIVEASLNVATFGVRCSDGSEFFFMVDRYGNVTDIAQAGGVR